MIGVDNAIGTLRINIINKMALCKNNAIATIRIKASNTVNKSALPVPKRFLSKIE